VCAKARKKPNFDLSNVRKLSYSLSTNDGACVGEVNRGKAEIYTGSDETRELVCARKMRDVKQHLKFVTKHKPTRYAMALLYEYQPTEELSFIGFVSHDRTPWQKRRGAVVYLLISKAGHRYIMMQSRSEAALASYPDAEELASIKGRDFRKLRKGDMSALG